MGYGTAIVGGANVVAGIKRPKLGNINVQPARGRRLSSPSVQQNSTKDQAAQDKVSEEYQRSRRELMEVQEQSRQEQISAQKDSMAKDYDMALAGLSIGNTAMAEDFLNNYGSSDMNAKIATGENGEIVVTPTRGNQMTFSDSKDFYSNFFGALKPERSRFVPAGKQKQEQSWSPFADGTRILDRKTGEIRETGYQKPEQGTASGKGRVGSGKKSSGQSNGLMDQVDNYIMNRVLGRNGEADSFMMDGEDGTSKKVDFDRVKLAMTPDEIEAYNDALLAAGQMSSDSGDAEHVIANKLFRGIRDRLEGGNKQQPRELTEGGQQQEKPQPAVANVKANNAGVEKLSKYLATLPVEEYDAALKELSQSNPDLVIAYRNKRKGDERKSLAQNNQGQEEMPASTADAESPLEVQQAMERNVYESTAGIRNLSDSAIAKVGEVLIKDPVNYWIVEPWKRFQDWAQNRYGSASAEALQEYAKENPEDAKAIQQVAMK